MAGIQIIENPCIEKGRIKKGAVSITNPEEIIKEIPMLKKYFYIIGCYGGKGFPSSKIPDIKTLENPSFFNELCEKFPQQIIINTAIADYVDSDLFKPLGIKKEYTGIQIASWTLQKRNEILIKACSLIPRKKFIKFGHFVGPDIESEITLKKEMIDLSKKIGANIYFPDKDAKSNQDISFDSEKINYEINKAKMGILTSKEEGCNIFKIECLFADIPFLVSKDSNIAIKKHINEKTGYFYDPTPEGLAKAISYVEKNLDKFSPREYALKNTGQKISIIKLINALNSLAEKDGFEPYFNHTIYFERRRWIWNNNKSIKIIKNIIKKTMGHRTLNGAV